jgi:pimeloyl-ACP methyl ester carboxylesterase
LLSAILIFTCQIGRLVCEGTGDHIMATDMKKDGIVYSDRPGTALPIVLLHGTGFSRLVFSGLFDHGLLAGHRIIAVDLPGQGESDDAPSEKVYSFRGLAERILELLHQIGVQRCIIAGWSLGGQIAFEMLQQRTSDTSTPVAGVLTFGAAPTSPGLLAQLSAFRTSRMLVLGAKAKYDRNDAERVERSCLGQHGTGSFVADLMRTDSRLRPALLRSLASGQGQLALLQCSVTPVLLIHGEHDPIIRTNYMRRIKASCLFGGRTMILPDAGHAAFLDQPDLFAMHLARFAASISDSLNQIAEPERLADCA